MGNFDFNSIFGAFTQIIQQLIPFITGLINRG